MGPPQQGTPKTHVETRYYIDPKGNVSQRQVQVADSPQAPPAAQPEHRYYRRPDGSVVRQKVTPAPTTPQRVAPVAPAAAPAAVYVAQSPQVPAQRQPAPAQRPPPRPASPQPQQKRVSHKPARRSPRWTGKRVLKHVVVISVIILLLLWPTTIPNLQALVDTLLTGEPGIQFFPESAEITLERVDTLMATGAVTWNINISRPFHIPGIHEVKGLTTSPNPTSEYVYKDQDWMYWEGSIPSSGGSDTLTLTYHMKLYSTVWEEDEEDSGTVSDVETEYKRYLGDEWKITPSDPEVQALSREIVGDETNVYLILRSIYVWMDDNLVYNTQRSSEPKSCSQTLADGNGDCDDQSILLASLARAAGVPVWLNLGIIYDPVRNYWGGHGWNNVYIPLKDGGHVIATVDIVNRQFLFRDPYHISDYLDNGDGEDLRDYYTSWSYRYSTGPSGPPRVTSEETYNIIDIKTTGSVVYTAP